MSKKLSLISTFFVISSLVFGELHKPNRIVEFATEVEAGISNNYFSTSDVLVKDLVIDLTKIADEMSDNGFLVEYSLTEKNSLSVNVNEYFRLGFFADVNGSGYLNLGKELFDFLGKGYEVGQSVSMKVDTYADLYLESGISFKSKIAGFGFTVKPSYYVPVLYVPNPHGKVSWSSNENGKLEINASADLQVYSAVNLKSLLEKDSDDSENLDVQQNLVDSLSNGGFNLSFEVEHRILGRMLEAGVFAQIPITPGKLNYEMKRTITASVHTSDNGILDLINDNKPEIEHDFGEAEYSEVSKKFYKPLNFGFELLYRPFGSDWLSLNPMFGVVARNPYSSDIEFYPEYNLPVTLKLFNVLGMTLSTGYLNKAFIHRASFMINARVLELDFGCSLRSTEFVKSFSVSGATAFFAVKIGF